MAARKPGEMRVLCCDPPSPPGSAGQMVAQSEIATAAPQHLSQSPGKPRPTNTRVTSYHSYHYHSHIIQYQDFNNSGL